MKADLKTSPCSALADKLQLIDCALDTAQTQAENCRAEREKLQEELNEARQQLSSADNGVAVLGKKVNEQQREIDLLTEERDELKARLKTLESQRAKPGLIGRLLKGRQP